MIRSYFTSIDFLKAFHHESFNEIWIQTDVDKNTVMHKMLQFRLLCIDILVSTDGQIIGHNFMELHRIQPINRELSRALIVGLYQSSCISWQIFATKLIIRSTSQIDFEKQTIHESLRQTNWRVPMASDCCIRHKINVYRTGEVYLKCCQFRW